MLIFLILILILVGIFGFIVIRDLLFLMRFFKEQKKIYIYRKNFKKYQDDKKKILDKRLQNEKQIREEYGLDYVQEINTEVVGFVEPVGEHSEREFEKNYKKYALIALAAKNGKSAYWQNMIKIAGVLGREQGMGK